MRLPETIVTARLRGRAFEQSDLPYMLQMDGDPRVQVPIFGHTFSEAQARARFERWLGIRRESGLGFYIFSTSTGAVVGHAGLFPSRTDPADVELGYALIPEHWGQGYATEMSLALLESAFWEPAIERIAAVTRHDNTRSRRVLAKAGLVHERAFSGEDGAPLVRYVIPRQTWLESRTLRAPIPTNPP